MILVHPSSFGNRADRMAQYQVGPARRAARNLRGAGCEYSRLGTLRVAGVPLFHGPSRADRSPAPSRPRWVTAKQRVTIARGDRVVVFTHHAWRARTSGTQVVSRLGRMFERTPTVRPDSRDFGPLPGSIGAADHGDTKSARGDLATLDSPHPTLDGLSASPRLSVALTVVYS